MVNSMGLELSQADFKAIGRSRGFAAETGASRELMQHVFLSEQGVAPALAALTADEIAGLHLLHGCGDQVDVEFFQRIYPSAVTASDYARYNDRFKGLFQQVKAQLIQRGLLLFGTLPENFSFWSGGAFACRRRLARCSRRPSGPGHCTRPCRRSIAARFCATS